MLPSLLLFRQDLTSSSHIFVCYCQTHSTNKKVDSIFTIVYYNFIFNYPTDDADLYANFRLNYFTYLRE